MSYRGRILYEGKTRYLVIEEVFPSPHDPAATLARIALTGRGTVAELERHLAEQGYAAKGWKDLPGAGELRSMLLPVEPEPEPEPALAPRPVAVAETPAMFARTECTQLRGQVDVFEAIAEAERETAAAAEAAPELPGDGGLFALHVTDEPADGALFGIGV